MERSPTTEPRAYRTALAGDGCQTVFVYPREFGFSTYALFFLLFWTTVLTFLPYTMSQLVRWASGGFDLTSVWRFALFVATLVCGWAAVVWWATQETEISVGPEYLCLRRHIGPLEILTFRLSLDAVDFIDASPESCCHVVRRDGRLHPRFANGAAPSDIRAISQYLNAALVTRPGHFAAQSRVA